GGGGPGTADRRAGHRRDGCGHPVAGTLHRDVGARSRSPARASEAAGGTAPGTRGYRLPGVCAGRWIPAAPIHRERRHTPVAPAAVTAAPAGWRAPVLLAVRGGAGGRPGVRAGLGRDVPGVDGGDVHRREVLGGVQLPGRGARRRLPERVEVAAGRRGVRRRRTGPGMAGAAGVAGPVAVNEPGRLLPGVTTPGDRPGVTARARFPDARLTGGALTGERVP